MLLDGVENSLPIAVCGVNTNRVVSAEVEENGRALWGGFDRIEDGLDVQQAGFCDLPRVGFDGDPGVAGEAVVVGPGGGWEEERAGGGRRLRVCGYGRCGF